MVIARPISGWYARNHCDGRGLRDRERLAELDEPERDNRGPAERRAAARGDRPLSIAAERPRGTGLVLRDTVGYDPRLRDDVPVARERHGPVPAGGEPACIAGLAAIGGLVLTLIVDRLIGALHGPFLELWAAVAAEVAALFNSAMLALVGRWAIVPTRGLFIAIGNVSSGGAVAPPCYRRSTASSVGSSPTARRSRQSEMLCTSATTSSLSRSPSRRRGSSARFLQCCWRRSSAARRPAEDPMTEGDSDVTPGSGQSGEERRPTIALGLVVTPLLEAEAVEQLATDVQRELAERYPDVGWEITAVRDALVTPPAALAEVVDAARSRPARRALGPGRPRDRASVADFAASGGGALEPNARCRARFASGARPQAVQPAAGGVGGRSCRYVRR